MFIKDKLKGVLSKIKTKLTIGSSSSDSTGIDNTKGTNPETTVNRYPDRPSDIQGSVELPGTRSPVELPAVKSPTELPTVSSPGQLPTINGPVETPLCIIRSGVSNPLPRDTSGATVSTDSSGGGVKLPRDKTDSTLGSSSSEGGANLNRDSSQSFGGRMLDTILDSIDSGDYE